MQGAEELPSNESFQVAQMDGRLPSTWWILLDNRSTVNIFCIKALLRNIKVTDRCMHVWCNTGWTVTNLIGHFPGPPSEVWYNLDGIANILSLADAEKYFHVHYNSSAEKAFIVKKADDSIHWLIQTMVGLYYLNTATASCTETGTALLLTVADKKSKYPERIYQQAFVVCRLQGMIGHPSTRDFFSFVDRNLIPNCPVTRLAAFSKS
jgi:hypothetical protein